MDIRSAPTQDGTWLGDQDKGFNDGNLWIGRHSVDGDILVFDPTLTDPAASNISFFSLSQFRQRTFPRSVVAEKIEEITDKSQRAKVKKEYQAWATLKATHEEEQSVARAEARTHQRESIIEQHRQFLAARNIPYQGVRDPLSENKPMGLKRRRRTKCHTCGIALDDFVGAECVVCNGVLCSCGSCGCGVSAGA